MSYAQSVGTSPLPLGVMPEAEANRVEEPPGALVSHSRASAPGSPGPFGSLNLVESQSIPPEAPSSLRAAPGEDPNSADWDINSGPSGRFDEPSAIQLETRGITAPVTPSLRTSRPEGSQPEFWTARTQHKNSVAAKLRTAGRPDLAEKLEHCHTEYTFAVCRACGRVSKFPNRCDLFYCPECQPRLALERRKAVEWWTSLVTQPKHIVLTLMNVPDLTRGHVKEAKKRLSALRRRKFCANWQGGCWSLEVTNEGRGWHLHFHLLVSAKWIDAAELARQWSDVTRGMGKIVKVKDARGDDYLRELTKYIAKGSQVAAWTPDEVRTFVESFDGERTFGVFGTLYGARTEFQEWLDSIRDKKPLCECGSSDLAYYSETDFLLLDLTPAQPHASRPPPVADRQSNLSLNIAQQNQWRD